MNFLWAIGLLVISYAITALTAKKPVSTDAKPATFQDFNFPQHKEGTPQAIIFGDCWSGDWMILHTGNFKSEAIRKKPQSSGKK
jgi:hypothetical protein